MTMAYTSTSPSAPTRRTVVEWTMLPQLSGANAALSNYQVRTADSNTTTYVDALNVQVVGASTGGVIQLLANSFVLWQVNIPNPAADGYTYAVQFTRPLQVPRGQALILNITALGGTAQSLSSMQGHSETINNS